MTTAAATRVRHLVDLCDDDDSSNEDDSSLSNEPPEHKRKHLPDVVTLIDENENTKAFAHLKPGKRIRTRHQNVTHSDDDVVILDVKSQAPASQKHVHFVPQKSSDDVEIVAIDGVARIPPASNFPESDSDIDFLDSDDDETGRFGSNLEYSDDEDEVMIIECPEEHEALWMLVLEVFPDAQADHVKALIPQFESVDEVLTHLVEHGYPKVAAKPAPNATIVHRHDTEKSSSLDFKSASSFDPNPLYKTEVVECIMTTFPFLSAAGARAHLKHSKWHYAICHENICNFLVGKDAKELPPDEAEERKLLCLKNALAGNELTSPQKRRLRLRSRRALTLQTPSCKKYKASEATDPTLKEEVDFVNKEMNDWMQKVETRISRRNIREASKLDGSAVQCNCCFDEYALEEMVACREEGHLFCTECLCNYAENQIFGNGTFGINCKTKKPAMELLCMHGDGCSSGFQQEQLRKALSVKVLAKYDELTFQKVVDAANMDDMCTCPKCGFKAALAKSEMIFRCPVSDCLYESCRKCGEPSHIPLRCEEVEKQRETNGRVTVEEAISKAKIRTCPKCVKSFIKSDGCNKITCACGALVCYVCQKQITGYQHFCQTAHCTHESCGKCKLFSDAEEDDKRAMREAGLQAAEQVLHGSQQKQEGSTKAADSVAQEVRVDVEKLLHDPVAKVASRYPIRR